MWVPQQSHVLPPSTLPHPGRGLQTFRGSLGASSPLLPLWEPPSSSLPEPGPAMRYLGEELVLKQRMVESQGGGGRGSGSNRPCCHLLNTQGRSHGLSSSPPALPAPEGDPQSPQSPQPPTLDD